MHASPSVKSAPTDTVCGAGIALRVPTPNVSVVDLVIQVEKKTLAEEVNEAFRQVSGLAGVWKHIKKLQLLLMPDDSVGGVDVSDHLP